MRQSPKQPASAAGKHSKQLTVAFGINLGLFVAEVVGGILAGSLALLADAGHMMVDTVAIGLSLAAIYFARRSPTPKRSFGFYRLEILAAVISGVLLFGVGIAVLVGAVLRLINPPTVSSGLMLVFGIVALAGNGIAAWLLLSGQKESLTMRAAFLDFLADAFGALAVVIAAVVIGATGFSQADAIASIVITLLILPRTWKLLGRTVNVLLEATPEGVDLEEVRRHILETDGVAGSHDLHAWTITSGMNVLSVHVILKDGADGPQVLDRLAECLADHFDIEHSTFQLEPATHWDHERAVHH
ncbi:MAG: cation diffusion facilitator family transporter [Actinomycetota bacterium]|nr:cation diffusion facilitator family transporter [Actinomycetota bacterium]